MLIQAFPYCRCHRQGIELGTGTAEKYFRYSTALLAPEVVNRHTFLLLEQFLSEANCLISSGFRWVCSGRKPRLKNRWRTQRRPARDLVSRTWDTAPRYHYQLCCAGAQTSRHKSGTHRLAGLITSPSFISIYPSSCQGLGNTLPQ